MPDVRREGPSNMCKSRPISDLEASLHRYEHTDVSLPVSRISRLAGLERGEHVRRFDMPATQIKLNDRDEALNGVVELGDGEEHLGVAHEVGYALQHASRLENEGGQNDST